MTDIYLTISLSTHSEDDTPQNYWFDRYGTIFEVNSLIEKFSCGVKAVDKQHILAMKKSCQANTDCQQFTFSPRDSSIVWKPPQWEDSDPKGGRSAIHYYWYFCYHLYARYLQFYTSNKPCLYGIQCFSCSVFTVSATCNVISHVKYVLYFYISTFRSMCAVLNTAVDRSSLIYNNNNNYYYYYYRISHFSALAVKYSPIQGCSNQQD